MSLVPIQSLEDRLRDEVLQLRELFSLYDKQGEEGLTNSITRQKLKTVLAEQLEYSVSDADLDNMIAAVDLNDSGDIQFNEFLKLMEKKNILLAEEDNEEEEEVKQNNNKMPLQFNREEIKVIFKTFDANNDNLITLEELRRIFQMYDNSNNNSSGDGSQSNNSTLTDEQLFAIIHLVEPNNKSGAISYNSFVRLMLSPDIED
jgi:Ca2+-binding EF-hand superfamily protein